MSESAWDKIRRLTQERDDARRERDTLALGIIHPVPELSEAERTTWERFETAPHVVCDCGDRHEAGWPANHVHATQYARLDLTFRADT